MKRYCPYCIDSELHYDNSAKAHYCLDCEYVQLDEQQANPARTRPVRRQPQRWASRRRPTSLV